jgi:uncharacterized membrane protein
MRGEMSEDSLERVPAITEPPGREVETSAEPKSVERLQEILERQGLPRAKAQVVLREVRTEIFKAHIGPLPAVEDFAGYNEVCPGSAKEILDMAVRQQKHSHDMDKYNAHSEFWLPILGMAAAVLVVIAMIGSGVYLAATGHEALAAAVLSGTGIVTAAGVFLQRRKAEDPATQPPKTSGGMLTRREKRARASDARRANRDRG